MSPKQRSLPVLLFLLVAAACGDGPVVPPTVEGHTFHYRAPAGAPPVTSISVRGAFNGWIESPMTRQADGSWRLTIAIDPGTHEYKFFINGSWPTDMCNDRTWGQHEQGYWIDLDADGCVPDGHGGQNAVVRIGEGSGITFSHDPLRAAFVSVADDRLSIRFRTDRGAVHSATVIADGESWPMHPQLGYGLHELWRGTLPRGTTSYRIAIQAAGATREFGPFTSPADPFSAVPWVGESVGYQIFPERFWNGDPGNDHWTLATDVVHYMNPKHWSIQPVFTDDWGGPVLEFHCCHQYFGGDLQGIIDRLDHLQSLGVTLIYLNPIFLAGSAHGYDTFDYLKVAPNFGDEAVLARLMQAARARGMRVMWDFVPNHVGVGHWAFQHAVQHGEQSPYWSWFRFKVSGGQVEVGHGGHYEGWWGFGSLPLLETRNAQVFEHLLEVTRYWTSFGFDGIRVDVPNELRNRAEFFPAFRQAAKGIDPDVYLVGEIWDRGADWLRGNEFDALMNYAIGEGVIERFARGNLGAGAAAYEMAQLYAEYPEASAAMQFNLISSHDTDRLLTKMGGGALGQTPSQSAVARHRLASAMLYALPGVPVTFQGDECAFLGTGEGPREENRYPMQWHACDAEMVAHYRRLAELRRGSAALTSAVLRSPGATGPLLAFFRGEPGPGEVLVIFNGAQSPQTMTLPSGSWTDLRTGEVVNGSTPVSSLGWSYLRRG